VKRPLNAQKQWTAPALICFIGISAIISTHAYYYAGQSEIDARLEAYDALRRIVSKDLAGELQNHSITEQDKLLFHVGDSIELLDANISTLLKQLAANQSVEITRSENVSVENSDGLRWATVVVDVTGQEAAIYNFIRTIETSKPALLVTKLQLRSNVLPGTAETAEMPMSSEMTVSGAMLPVAMD
jgi:Type II secretion system (T2SS), protein M subtype b